MKKRALLILLLLSIVAPFSVAFETDQFTNRQLNIADSTALMNKQVNLAIASSIIAVKGPRKDMDVVNGIFHKIGGTHWVDKIERWAMDTDQVEKISPSVDNNIYSGHPVWATRVAFVFGVGATIDINGALVGTDKLGHFFSQGRKFYKRWLKSNDERKAAEHSAYTEKAIFGQMTTGSYSNADLVANYEGYRFYRSLFEDNIDQNKPAILAWKDDHWIMQRPFDWSDHVNDYWDEALNINHYDRLLYPHMKTRLLTFCDDYWDSPELFEIHDEDALKIRYQDIQLHDSSELRLSTLCPLDRQATDEITSQVSGAN